MTCPAYPAGMNASDPYLWIEDEEDRAPEVDPADYDDREDGE